MSAKKRGPATKHIRERLGALTSFVARSRKAAIRDGLELPKRDRELLVKLVRLSEEYNLPANRRSDESGEGDLDWEELEQLEGAQES